VTRADVRALDELEAFALGLVLLDQEEGQSSVCGAAVGVGACEQHENVGARGERAPGLGAVDEPAAWRSRRARRDARDVAPEIRFGHRDSGEDLAGGESRQPALLLFLRAAVHEGACQYLRSCDQRSANAEGAPGELLGRHHHAEVLRLATRGEPAELFGHRKSKSTELRQTGDHRIRDVGVGPVDVFGVRSNLLEGEAVERVGDHREVLTEVARSGSFGKARHELGIAVRSDERCERLVPVVLDVPESLASENPSGEVTQGNGEERGHELGFDFALGGVTERGARRGERARGVGHVVGEALVRVDAARAFQVDQCTVDHRLSAIEQIRRVGEIKWGSHH
jgi:hypothetical protein